MNPHEDPFKHPVQIKSKKGKDGKHRISVSTGPIDISLELLPEDFNTLIKDLIRESTFVDYGKVQFDVVVSKDDIEKLKVLRYSLNKEKEA